LGRIQRANIAPNAGAASGIVLHAAPGVHCLYCSSRCCSLKWAEAPKYECTNLCHLQVPCSSNSWSCAASCS
jgi:hypothetical protein